MQQMAELNTEDENKKPLPILGGGEDGDYAPPYGNLKITQEVIDQEKTKGQDREGSNESNEPPTATPEA